MQNEGYTKATGKPYPDYGIPLCNNSPCPRYLQPMGFWGKTSGGEDRWECSDCSLVSYINPVPVKEDVVAHDNTELKTQTRPLDPILKAPKCGASPRCVNHTMHMYTDENAAQRYTVWKCSTCGAERHLTSHEFLVNHDNTEPKTTDITQEDWTLLLEALEIAVTCKEVEVDVAQAEADSKADTLRDLVVLKRKLETA